MCVSKQGEGVFRRECHIFSYYVLRLVECFSRERGRNQVRNIYDGLLKIMFTTLIPKFYCGGGGGGLGR